MNIIPSHLGSCSTGENMDIMKEEKVVMTTMKVAATWALAP